MTGGGGVLGRLAAAARMDNRRADITETLRRHIEAGLHLGTLEGGDRLPSLRRLGAELRADPRTVLAAYQRLAEQGLVCMHARSGVFVAERARRGARPLPETASWVIDVFLRGLSQGIAPNALRRDIRACFQTARVRAACLECNDDQIHALCSQLRGDYGFGAVGIDSDALGRGEPVSSTAAQADLILTTRFHASEAQRLGRRLGRPVLVATLDPVFVNTLRGMLASGPLWWVCTDPRFVAKMPRILPGVSVNPVVYGRDPLDVIPREAPVYVTRRAAGRLPRRWRDGRYVTLSRVFSRETARALLEFGIRRTVPAAVAPPRRT